MDCPNGPPCGRNALLLLDLGILRPDDVGLLLPCTVMVSITILNGTVSRDNASSRYNRLARWEIRRSHPYGESRNS